jgi:hypothetical protein
MKRLALLLALTIFAIPAVAQDDGGGGGGGGGGESVSVSDDDFSDDFGPQSSQGPKFDPLVDLRSWLAKASAPPLDKKQEKPLNKLYEKEVKAMEKSFEKQFGIPLATAMAAQNSQRGGRRGGGFARTSPEQSAEITRLSAQLVDKVIAGLRIDQQAALRKYQSEQLRVRRLNIITQSMALAGLPLTAEQKTQVEALYARESHLRTLLIVEAKGQPHQAKTGQLELQTSQRVVRLLNPNQRTALSETMARLRGQTATPAAPRGTPAGRGASR